MAEEVKVLFHLILINLNLNSHVWLVTTLLHSPDLGQGNGKCRGHEVGMSLCLKKQGQCSWGREGGRVAGDGAERSAGPGLVKIIIFPQRNSFMVKDIWRAPCLK